MLLVLAVDPYAFGVNSLFESLPTQLMVQILLVFFSTVIIPAFATFLMIQLGLVKSFTMEDRMDRTGPLIASGIFYLWVFWNLYSNSNTPKILIALILGTTIGLFVVFFFNIFFKIRAHMTGMGGWIGAILILLWVEHYQFIPISDTKEVLSGISLFDLLAVSFVLAGLVGMARLQLKAHNLEELVYGFLGGLASMFIGYGVIF